MTTELQILAALGDIDDYLNLWRADVAGGLLPTIGSVQDARKVLAAMEQAINQSRREKQCQS